MKGKINLSINTSLMEISSYILNIKNSLKDFKDSLAEKWSKIEQYKLNQDMKNYAIEVHSLKSDCKYLGFMDLANVAYEHEMKSKENDVDFVNNNFDRLSEEYTKLLNILDGYSF